MYIKVDKRFVMLMALSLVTNHIQLAELGECSCCLMLLNYFNTFFQFKQLIIIWIHKAKLKRMQVHLKHTIK